MARHGVQVLTKQRTDSVPGAPAATARAHNTRPTCVAHIKALFVVMTSHFPRSFRNLWSIRLTSSRGFEMFGPQADHAIGQRSYKAVISRRLAPENYRSKRLTPERPTPNVQWKKGRRAPNRIHSAPGFPRRDRSCCRASASLATFWSAGGAPALQVIRREQQDQRLGTRPLQKSFG